MTGNPAEPLTAVDWDSAAFEYLTAAGWDRSGPFAAVQRRDQRDVQVLGIDASTGATRVLAGQHDDAWVHPVPGLPARTSSGVLLTSTDISDTRLLIAAGLPVTPPGLQLGEVLAVDGETVLFTASGEPTQMHVWAYHPLAGLRQLSAEPGVHHGTGRAGTVVLVSRTPDRPGPRMTVRRTGSACGDAEATPVTSMAEPPALEPRVELLTLGPRALRAALFLPSWHQPGDPPLPVLMGPVRRAGHAQRDRRPALVDVRVAVVRRAGLRGAHGGRVRHPRPRARLGT